MLYSGHVKEPEASSKYNLMLHPGDSVSVFLSLGRPVSLNWGDTGVIKMPHSDGVVPDQPMYMEHRPKLLD